MFDMFHDWDEDVEGPDLKAGDQVALSGGDEMVKVRR
jgi:hypothetical protein